MRPFKISAMPPPCMSMQSCRVAAGVEHGFTIVSAIFLLVVLAGLGVAIARFSSIQHISSAQDMQGSRAYHAARAGLEWGIFQVLAPDVDPPAPGTATWPSMRPCPVVAPPTPIEGFTIELTCDRFPAGAADVTTGPPVFNEAGSTRSIIIYQLTARATSAGTLPGNVNYVERQISATVSRCLATDGELANRFACP